MSARVTTQAEDRQPALGRIETRYQDHIVMKLPVWLGRDGYALLVITGYPDGTRVQEVGA